MASVEQTIFLNQLPDEILLRVFTKLPLSDLLLSARPVCKRWARLSRDESLWTVVDLSLFLGSEHTDKIKNAEGVEALLFEIQDCVKKITFSSVPLECETYELFCLTPKNCSDICFSKLTSLDYSYSSVNLCHLRRALSTYSSITELFLIHTNISLGDIVTEAFHLPNLKKLVFHDIHAWDTYMARNLNSMNLTKVPKLCPLLEWVEIHTMWADFDDNVVHTFIEGCRHLKRLCFNWSLLLTEDAFRTKEKENALTHLGLAEKPGQEAYLYYVLPHFPQLTSLTIDGFQVYIEDCAIIGRCCPNLQELVFDIKDLRDPLHVFFLGLNQTDTLLCSRKLQEVVQHCRNLRKIHAPCSKVDDIGFDHLVKHCPLLEDINFMCCPHLTVKSLHAMSKYSHKLKYVNFQYTLSSHEYLYPLLSNCVQLREVIIDRKVSDEEHPPFPYQGPCSQRMYDSSKAVPTPKTSPEIEVDELPFIDVVDSEGESLSLVKSDTSNGLDSNSFSKNSACSTKEDSFIYFPILPDHCHVSTISMKDTDLSNYALQHIFKLCPDLTQVNLDRCPGLSDETIQTLAKYCQNLKILMVSSRRDIPNHMGDGALRALCKYSRNLESISILYNRNISHKGIFNILDALDDSLRNLESLSFCVGSDYKCKLPLLDVQWLKYLSKSSVASLEEALSARESNYFRILHLDFLTRRV